QPQKLAADAKRVAVAQARLAAQPSEDAVQRVQVLDVEAVTGEEEAAVAGADEGIVEEGEGPDVLADLHLLVGQHPEGLLGAVLGQGDEAGPASGDGVAALHAEGESGCQGGTTGRAASPGRRGDGKLSRHQ